VPVNLHLGCGKRFLPGFVHIDLADFPHIDHRHDIRTLPMIKDGTVDLIYTSHALAYFDRIEVQQVLREWHRVLRRGGTLRIAVPDFEALVKLYQKTGKLDNILGPLFGRWPIQTPDGEEVLFERTVYDFDSLRATLEGAGFSNVRRYDWRQTLHKDHDDHSQAYFPHMDKDKGLLISLNVEATRP
jgi:predicted SAM-dependent methyltransferase